MPYSRYLVLLPLLALTACQPRQPAAPADDGRQPAGAEADEQRCTNLEAGFSVAYPAGWHTNTGEIMPPCSVFDPEPVVIPPATEIPEDLAVVIGLADEAFETVAAETMGERVLAREETTVGGYRAVRIESVTTGEGLFDAGLHGTRYVIDLGDRVLVAETRDAGEPDYAEKQRRLEAMVASLRFP